MSECRETATRQWRHREKIADECMSLAARISVRSGFGWCAPDCVTLQEAARFLRGQTEQKVPDIVDGVISAFQ